jgi:sodium pump decarboxylase gamma subunit
MLYAQQDSGLFSKFTLQPLFEDHGIPLAVMGVLVVFLALVLVVAFITLLPRVLAKIPQQQPEPSDSFATLATADEELSEEMLIVIAAAVAETMSAPHRIVRIGGSSTEDLGWSLEGRMKHHQSHSIQPRDRR